MEKISINKNGLGIFRTNKSAEKTAQNTASTNPFGINFKGNVIQADVFETTKSSPLANFREKLANRGKIFKSSMVSGVNSFNNALKSRVDSVVNFGRKIRENVSDFWNKANNINVGSELKNTFSSIYDRFKVGNEYSVKNLTKRPVNDLEAMLREELNVQ